LQAKSDKPDTDIKDWYKLVDNRDFVFEFKVNIKLSLLKDFLNISETSSDSPSGVLKMIISPWADTTNYNSNTIYINDGIKIYKYTLQLNPKGSLNDKISYDNIIKDLTDSTQKGNVKVYSFLKQAVGDNLLGFNDDLIVVTSGNKFVKYNGLATTMFPGFKSKDLDTNKIALKILGSEKDNYDTSIDETNKTIELKTLNNIYKVYSNGFMEYTYVPAQSSSLKGEFNDAFRNALEFVKKLGLISDNTSLFLSGYNEDNDKYYKFEFDYMVSDAANDFPIYLNYNYKDSDGTVQILHNSIIITANSKNVLSCTAMLKAFKFTSGTKDYGIGLGEANYVKDPKLLADKTTTGRDVSISYEMGNEEENKDLNLLWVVKAGDNYYPSTIIINK
jgi:hypothetical protein